jgi:hypothetical protein
MENQNRPHRSQRPQNNRRFDKRRNENRMPLDSLLHADNTRVYKCFHKSKKTGTLETFGVYNTITKKHAIFYTTNFFPQDFLDIKMVTLETK